DERGAATLDGVAAGPVLPLPRADVPLHVGGRERRERDLARRPAQMLCRTDAQTEAGVDDVRPAGERPQERPRLAGVSRLLVDAAVHRDERVDAEDALAGNRRGLAAGMGNR